MIRVIAVFGWICFALDAALIIALIVVRDAGSDAAGRGVGRTWGMILLPILLVAGALLYWSTRSGSKFGTVAATVMVALPFIFLAQGRVQQMRENRRAATQHAEHGQFADADLNAIAQTIAARDTAALQAALALLKAQNTTVNYAERDRAGETLLGFAATRAMDPDGTMNHVAALRILLNSGVPYAADAQRVGEDWSFEALTGNADKFLEIATIALDAGADAKQMMRYDRAPIIMSYQVSVPKLRLLVQHGADVHVRNERGETTLFNMVRFKKYAEALFFLQQGVDPAIASSDGQTVQGELEKGVAEYRAQQRPMEPGYEAFATALRAHASRQD
ncbi:MAG: hypothetical protein IT353_20990 [Gemmatimonadaceae bacterium]|nr:hypothetical protein [Gemmatimonadaceae bacterium]